jgi:formylglycine-generating enzyme required for sulfatase activity
MGKKRSVMGKVSPLSLLLALITGCSSKAVCREGQVSADMVFIPAGEFIMGDNEGDDDEKPERKVFLPIVP